MKSLEWVGSSKRDLREFPDGVRATIGQALYLAELGRKDDHAKPLKGLGGAGVLEVVASDDGDAYRAVYTVRFENAVYVLHCFQKKSRKGRETPQSDLNVIEARLGEAQRRYSEWERNRESK